MWNTYHAKGLNSVVHTPDLGCVRVGLYDRTRKFLLENMLWRSPEGPLPEYDNVKRFGAHAEDGSYFDIVLRYRDFSFRLDFASDGEAFVMELTPEQPGREDILFYISPLVLWGREGGAAVAGNDLTLRTAAGEYAVHIEGERAADERIYAEALGVPVRADGPVRLLCNTDAAGAHRLMAEKRAACQAAAARSGGWLGDASEAIWKALIWNTIYDPVKERVCVPVSRAWCTRNGQSFGSYVLFEWDTFFASLMGGTLSRQTAYQQVHAIMAEATEAGMIPNFGSQRGGSPDRSQPPVGAYCLLKLYRQFGDRALLERYYSLLRRWNRWWFQHRDGNGDGLLEWGSDPIPDGINRGYFDEGNTMLTAMYESGLDNSPMYDGIPFNGETHAMELNDVGLNALYAMDCQALADIADILGEAGDAAELRAEHARMRELMNGRMYDPEVGMYCNTRWDGTRDYRFSPTNFYPLLADIAAPEQVAAMKRHLLSEEEFWGEYVIPSISRQSPAYPDQDYWRGRIWGPMNFLVYEGLRRVGETETAAAFAEKSFHLFRGEWEGESHIHENYNADTGDGDDRFNADPFYTWGALLAYLPVCEYIYIAPEGGVRFGSAHLPGAYVRDFPLADAAYTLDTREGFALLRNGEAFIDGGEGLVLSFHRLEAGTLTLEVETPGSTLTLRPQADIQTVRALHGGKVIHEGPLAEGLTIATPAKGGR